MGATIVSVVGARPQFIKSAVVSHELRKVATEILVHTGQHYDYEMSGVFFEELQIPTPDHNLDVGSGSHGWQTGQMLIKIEAVLEKEKPDWLLLYGDTNSTLAGALAGAKLHVNVAHVEAGLRSFNRGMPEEINRVLCDRVSSLLFCPSDTAVKNLAAEGIKAGVHLVGDVMHDVMKRMLPVARERSRILSRLGLEESRYLLATIHRAENTDNPQRLRGIIEAFNRLNETVILPLHPRTRKETEKNGLRIASHVHVIEPLGYLDMIRMEQTARIILTDSGGIQKEAYWLGVPCITLRDETEWNETAEAGWNIIAGADATRIVEAVNSLRPPATRLPLYGDGNAAGKITAILMSRSQ
ncbi:MAG TPA: UDP-N-acetylglucosamine 2-epimerase (non-hydrolyzing) [Syntrophales bacterium]|nr:UDP-N-acetylglucosamine 2-epimerase (non-hydrolyzing) [Syntrophobacterales bacterium]HOG08619.1 UDP-N-acetylglucosamine 2-epimerase (non-hydrolyzing) [Syntrophales bacterium]